MLAGQRGTVVVLSGRRWCTPVPLAFETAQEAERRVVRMPAAELTANSMATPAQIATAAVTGAGVLTALGLTVIPAAWRRHKRPRLHVSFGDQPPLLALEPSPTSPVAHVMRARVTNVGSGTAMHVRAQTTGLWFTSAQPRAGSNGWQVVVDLPKPHAWESRADVPSTSAETVDLAHGMSDHVRVISKNMNIPSSQSKDHWTQALGGKGVDQLNSQLVDQLSRIGEYCVGITVFGDESEPVTSYCYYRLSADARQIVDLRQGDFPPLVRQPTYGELAAVFKGNEMLA